MTDEKAAIIQSKEGIKLVGLVSLRQRLRLEKAGMRCKGPSASSLAKKRYRLPRNASMDSLISRISAEIDQLETEIVKKRLSHYEIGGKK